MLNQEDVDINEEMLNEQVRTLNDEQRKHFYDLAKKAYKDPDTYAALNWFFVAGLHHFYLKKWLMGLIDLSFFTVGVILIFTRHAMLGISFIVIISLVELWALFRSQIIIQDWNTQIQWKILKSMEGTSK